MRLYCENINDFIGGVKHFYTVQENRFVKGKVVTLYSDYKECDFKIKHVLIMYNQETGEDDRVLHLEKIDDSGTRSGLLWESERIIKAKKPKYLLMENVKNLISEKFMPGFVEWILALEKLGYSNYYEVLNAKDFGVPQNRERVFVVSILGEREPYVFPKPINLEKRLKDALEDEVDEKYYLDNERAQQLVATITDKQNTDDLDTIEPERVLGIFDKENSTHQSGSVYNKDKIAPTLDTMQGGWRQPSIIEPETKQVLQYNSENRENTQRFRTYDPSGIAPTLNTMQGGGLEPHIPEPSFVVGSTQKNASVTDGSYSPTLTSSMGTGGGHVPMIDEPKIAAKGVVEIIQKPRGYNKGGTHKISPSITTSSWQENNLLSNSYRIRKLTPLECWRLMDVTDEDFYKAQAVNSNTQLIAQTVEKRLKE